MSNSNRPKLSLPGSNPPPPPPPAAPSNPPGTPKAAGIAERFADVFEQFPTPWVVGPFGDIWVGADIEVFDPETDPGARKIPGPGGTFWRATKACLETTGKPRIVAEISEVENMHPRMGALIVAAVNAL